MDADTQSEFYPNHVALANTVRRTARRRWGVHRFHGSIFALSLICLVPGFAQAQSAPAQPGAATPDMQSPELNKLEEMVVVGVPPAENIMPTQHSSTSIYGLDLGVMNTPRNT